MIQILKNFAYDIETTFKKKRRLLGNTQRKGKRYLFKNSLELQKQNLKSIIPSQQLANETEEKIAGRLNNTSAGP